MVEIRKPILVDEAIQRVMEKTLLGREKEEVALGEADGRYLAEDLIADHPVPFFDRTPLDGFAIRAQDSKQASFDHPVSLRVVDAIGAGFVAKEQVRAGEAIRVMTGSPIPSGADAIVMLELTQPTTKDGQDWIQINRQFQPGDNLSKRGEDTQEGTILAKAGRRITAGEMAMLATFGYSQVSVYKQPVVGIFATGTELLDVDQPLQPGKIRNSNSYMLESQIRRVGAIPKFYGILPDDLELCYQQIASALEEVDFIITTGGVSVGDFDYVPEILARLEAQVLFNKIAMRPGSVTTVAVKQQKWIFGLSGNPAACYVGFELFTRPVLRRIVGSDQPHLPRGKAIINHDISKPNAFTRFMRAKKIGRGNQLTIQSVGLDKSGVASALIEADALLIIPPGSRGVSAGQEVEYIDLDRAE